MSYLPEWLSRLVTPESYGEAVVGQIYGPGGTAQRGASDPDYNPDDLSSPNVYVQAKGVLTSLADTAQGKFIKVAMVIAAFVLVAVFVNGYARR